MLGVTKENIERTLEVLAIESFVRQQKLSDLSLETGPINKQPRIDELNKEIKILNDAFKLLDRKGR